MDFIIYAVIAAIGVYAGWHIRGVVMLALLSEHPDRVIKMLEKIKEINTKEELGIQIKEGIEVAPECVNNYWYAYAKDTNQFLGQGPSLEEALKQAATRFPDKKFWCEEPKQFSQSA